MSKLNIWQQFDEVTEYWSPRVVADANGQSVKLAKMNGEFVWHDHADEDEVFLVFKGQCVIRYRDRDDVALKEGDIHVVPKGVEHSPIAENDCWIMLFEPQETKHTGEVEAHLTKSIDAQRAHLV